MSRYRPRLCQALQQHGIVPTDHVWVSDRFVSETFARFVRQHTRYGSSVPGPLEAQKRLSKRRNAALTLVQPPPPAMDAALLFGKPEIQQHPELQLLGPESWPLQSQETLAYFQGVAPPVPQPCDDVPHNVPSSSRAGDPIPYNVPYRYCRVRCQRLARKATSVAHYKELLAARDFLSRDRPHNISQIAFFQLLLVQNEREMVRRWDFSETHSFFSDPSLNVPEAENYVTLVDFHTKHLEWKFAVDAHFRFLQRSIELGLVPVEEISKIIKLIPHIKCYNDPKEPSKKPAHGTIGKTQWETTTLYYQAIWDGLKASAVLKPSDLGRETLELWAKDLVEKSPPDKLSTLCMEITDALGRFAIPDNLSDDILIFRMAQSAASVPEWTEENIPEADLHEIISYTESYLDSCSPERAVARILNITERLISRAHPEWRNRPMRIWYEILSRLENDLIVHTATSTLALLHPGTLSIPCRDRCIIRLWILTILGHRTSNYEVTEFRRLGVFRRICCAFNTEVRQVKNPDLLIGLRRLLQKSSVSSLPGVDLVLSNATDIVWAKTHEHFRRGQRLGYTGGPDSFDYTAKSDLLDPNHFPRSLDDMIAHYYVYARNREARLSALEYLVETTDLTSDAFVRQALTYIEAGTIPRSVILHLLNAHTSLHKALARSRLPSPTKRSHITKSGTPSLDPRKALDTLNKLALMFACTTTLTPWTAWRLTHGIYQLISRYGGPLEPPLVRALYQAGVSRYHDAGLRVARTRLLFIAEKIRKVEGSAVADEIIEREIYEAV
ncbi:hypothetical protein AJ79_06525 [Helicocarpus griseus UAMH5409]|uniref:Uncharacterized protein n=1 Tax=Helicocarpus griseus UAMH5409 TaxID=1447875 RepID=A0A2B7XBT7_9EURO|nr:hypothetical protein AJ79_06525 [Helicocarpus griseus UAMH5409]